MPAREPEALANAIRRLVVDDELRVRMGMQARRRAEQMFDERRVVALVLHIYVQLLRGSVRNIRYCDARDAIGESPAVSGRDPVRLSMFAGPRTRVGLRPRGGRMAVLPASDAVVDLRWRSYGHVARSGYRSGANAADATSVDLAAIDDRPEGVIQVSTTLPAGPGDLRSAGGYGDVEDIPLARPGVPDPSAVAQDVERILKSGVLTNGPYVRELESRSAEYLDVRECVAVASCTAGLMLLLRAAGLTGDVVIPSFTFAATAHAVAWNGLQPVFADVDPSTLTLSPEAVRRSMGVRTSAILATHIFGTPCEVEELEGLAARDGIKLFFDAAHAFGSLRRGVPVGRFGNGEVFSLSPTKVLVAGEGGIIATNDETLAERCRIGRDYGNPGDYDCRFVGLNARMSEVHAAIALNSLDGLEERIERRNTLVAMVPGGAGSRGGGRLPRDRRRATEARTRTSRSSSKEDAFGLDADGLGEALAAVGIETRRYYSPPVHTMRAYRRVGSNADVPVTDAMAAQTLTLPLWVEMTEAHIGRVSDAIGRIRRYVRNRTS